MIRLVFVLFLFLSFSPQVQAEEALAHVTRISGGVHIERGAQWYPAVEGMPLKEGDRVITEMKGQADISMNGVAGVRFLRSTQVTIKSLDERKMRLDMELGDVVMKMKRQLEGRSFELETPVAVAAVRGTQFWGRVDPTRELPVIIAVREGRVHLRIKRVGKSFNVRAGKAVDIPKETRGANKRAASEGELEAIAQAETILIEAVKELE